MRSVLCETHFPGRMTYDDTFLPTALIDLRESRDLTRQQVADATGVGVLAIQLIEGGDHPPSLKNFVKLCNGLGVSPDQLLRP